MDMCQWSLDETIWEINEAWPVIFFALLFLAIGWTKHEEFADFSGKRIPVFAKNIILQFCW
jgi:hypothetical protein